MTESDRRATFSAVPILAGFLGTLLQDADSSARDSGERGSDDTIYTCPDSTFNAAADICRRFLAVDGVADMLGDVCGCHGRLPSGSGAEVAGSDLYLTVAGHGAGFWDGDWEPHGEALTEAAQSVARWLEVYVGDDGRVYICGRE